MQSTYWFGRFNRSLIGIQMQRAKTSAVGQLWRRFMSHAMRIPNEHTVWTYVECRHRTGNQMLICVYQMQNNSRSWYSNGNELLRCNGHRFVWANAAKTQCANMMGTNYSFHRNHFLFVFKMELCNGKWLTLLFMGPFLWLYNFFNEYTWCFYVRAKCFACKSFQLKMKLINFQRCSGDHERRLEQSKQLRTSCCLRKCSERSENIWPI